MSTIFLLSFSTVIFLLIVALIMVVINSVICELLMVDPCSSVGLVGSSGGWRFDAIFNSPASHSFFVTLLTLLKISGCEMGLIGVISSYREILGLITVSD